MYKRHKIKFGISLDALRQVLSKKFFRKHAYSNIFFSKKEKPNDLKWNNWLQKWKFQENVRHDGVGRNDEKFYFKKKVARAFYICFFLNYTFGLSIAPEIFPKNCWGGKSDFSKVCIPNIVRRWEFNYHRKKLTQGML